MTGPQRLPDAVRTALAALADPARAATQQSYMKSAMPFRGVGLPDVRATVHRLLAEPRHRPGTRGEWESSVLGLWDGAEFREERSAAIVARHRYSLPWAAEPASMPLYEHLVITGAWWDHVDEIAPHLVGAVLRAHPATGSEWVRRWAREDCRWLRRAAILSQLSSKSATDRHLLLDCIEPNVGDRDVFVAKAVGWALRQYARVDDDAGGWVRVVLDAHPDLAPRTRREALRYVTAGPGRGR